MVVGDVGKFVSRDLNVKCEVFVNTLIGCGFE